MSLKATMLTSTSPHFPAALQSGTLLAPWPQIWALGNLDLLGRPLLGFFCATRCPGNVILRTYLWPRWQPTSLWPMRTLGVERHSSVQNLSPSTGEFTPSTSPKMPTWCSEVF